MERADTIVIGAGIVGLATAWQLARSRPQERIVILEKEAGVARHQSGHNSGVIHAGVYYPPGSLKARYCRAGVSATLDFCRQHDVAAHQCGKLIVASDALEVTRLRQLAANAASNGLACDWLDRDALTAREPAIVGAAALLVHDTGMTDYPGLCAALARELVRNNAEIRYHQAVNAIAESAAEIVVATDAAEYRAERLVVCGGLQADRLARLAAIDVDFMCIPFRGDYYRLPDTRAGLVRSHIYPVPDPRLPFLGVHLTLTIDGGITVGPSAMLALAREHYRRWALDTRDAADILRFPGTWRLLARFPGAALRELGYALSRRRYLALARRYCPALEADDLAQHACGIRAQIVRRDGSLVHDFELRDTPRSVHVLNAPSPAATSAFPIGQAIVERLLAAGS